MSVSVEKKEKNMAVLTVEVEADLFCKALDEAYNKEKNRIQVPGFRKGKAPRRMIEKRYGKEVFYEEAANIVLRKTYDDAVSGCGETVVSRPNIDVTQMEEGKNFIYTAEVALKPEVVLGQYKGVEITKADVSVTDEEVDEKIRHEQEQNARMIDVDDRAVEMGDHISLNFDGSIDGVPFDGGKAEDYELEVGSNSFIPGFEEQLVGKNIGEDFDVNVSFPEDYHAEELKGKEAVFKCKVNRIQIKELPELNDEFAQDVSEFNTLDEYRESVRKELQEKKDAEERTRRENLSVAEAVENASMDIPDVMVEEQADRLMDDFAQRLKAQGMTLEQYSQFTGITHDAMVTEMKGQALSRIRNSLVLEAVAKAEDIQISDERFEEEVEKMASQYKMEKEKFMELLGEDARNQMKEDLAVQEAVKLIADAALLSLDAEKANED